MTLEFTELISTIRNVIISGCAVPIGLVNPATETLKVNKIRETIVYRLNILFHCSLNNFFNERQDL